MRVRRWAGLGFAALALSAAGCTPSSATVDPTPTASAGTPSATTSAVTPSTGGPADLSVSGRILTNGSVGTPSGTITVTVKNQGSTTPAITLAFALAPEVTPVGNAWTACESTTAGAGRVMTCRVDPVAAGATATFRYDVTVKLGGGPAGTVIVGAVGADERDPSDNIAILTVCTNGC